MDKPKDRPRDRPDQNMAHLLDELQRSRLAYQSAQNECPHWSLKKPFGDSHPCCGTLRNLIKHYFTTRERYIRSQTS